MGNHPYVSLDSDIDGWPGFSLTGSRHKLYARSGPIPSSRISTTSPNCAPVKQWVNPVLFRTTQWKMVGFASSADRSQQSSLLSPLLLCCCSCCCCSSARNRCRSSSLWPFVRFPKTQSETPHAANIRGTIIAETAAGHFGIFVSSNAGCSL